MELVEDHKTHPLKRRIALQAARQDTFSNYLDARTRAYLAVETNAIAHGFADLLTQLTRHALRSSARRKAARFEHDDCLPLKPGLIEQREGNARRFTGARRCLEHHFISLLKGF